MNEFNPREFSEVWAIPGKGSIIDAINPLTGLTVICGKDAAAVLAQDPTAVRMSWSDWQAAAITRQQTPITWARTSAKEYNQMLNILPPALWTGGAFLVGEPYDHCFATGAPRFTAYRELRGSGTYDPIYLVASRPLTRAELRSELALGVFKKQEAE